jgi:hypothetical protein
MKKLTLALMGIAWAAAFCIAGEIHSEKEIKEDAARHRAIAAAHETAARCLGDKTDSATCLASLKSSCAGLGVGKYCGLKQEAWADAAKSLRLTAQAHQAVAQCFEAGKPYETCQWDLQTACKGLAIGKFCGLVHSHAN